MIDRENYVATVDIFETVVSIFNNHDPKIQFIIKKIEAIHPKIQSNIKLNNLYEIHEIGSQQNKIIKNIRDFLNKISINTLEKTKTHDYN